VKAPRLRALVTLLVFVLGGVAVPALHAFAHEWEAHRPGATEAPHAKRGHECSLCTVHIVAIHPVPTLTPVFAARPEKVSAGRQADRGHYGALYQPSRGPPAGR